jgi:hypothetical protein
MGTIIYILMRGELGLNVRRGYGCGNAETPIVFQTIFRRRATIRTMLRSHVLLRSPLLRNRSIVTVAAVRSLNGGKIYLQHRPPRMLTAVSGSPSSSSLRRNLSSDKSNNSTQKEPDKANKTEATEQAKTEQEGGTSSDSKEIVLTPGETVVAVTRLGMWGGIFAFACVCGYYIIKELMPT